MEYYRRENDRRKGKGNFMTATNGAKNNSEGKAQTRFVVTREFDGTQTMQQAFEQLIEKKTEEHISRKKDRQALA